MIQVNLDNNRLQLMVTKMLKNIVTVTRLSNKSLNLSLEGHTHPFLSGEEAETDVEIGSGFAG